jgi:hypothetical protein
VAKTSCGFLLGLPWGVPNFLLSLREYCDGRRVLLS